MQLPELPIRLVRVYSALAAFRYVSMAVLQLIDVQQRYYARRHQLTQTQAQDQGQETCLVNRCLALLGAHYRCGNMLGFIVYSLYSFILLSLNIGRFLRSFRVHIEDLDPYLYLVDERKACNKVHRVLGGKKSQLQHSYNLYQKTLQHQESHLSSLSPVKQNGPHGTVDHLANSGQVFRKLTFWPANRTEEWHARLKMYWIRLYLIIWLVGCGSALLVLLYLRHVVLATAQRPMSLADRLSILEETLFLPILTEFFGALVFKFIFVKVDHEKLHASLGVRMRAFLARLEDLRELYYRLDKEEGAKRYLEEAQAYCNKEALELYLGFQYFLFQQGAHRTIGNGLLTQYTFFLVGAVVVNSLTIRLVEAHHMSLVGSILAGFLLIYNVINIIGALTSAKLIRTFKLAWNLIARAQFFELPKQRQPHPNPTDSTRTNSFNAILMESTGVEHLFSRNHSWTMDGPPLQMLAAGEQPATRLIRLIDSHTSLLWFRLVQDRAQLASQVTYVALGFYALHSENVLKLNFGIISIGMTSLSDKYMFRLV